MQKTIACRLDLGMTRIAGYTLYDPNSMEFHETTPREVENLVKRGQVNGLVFNEQGELVPDLDGWSMGNLKIKSAVGRYRNWNTDTPKGDTTYSVVRAIQLTSGEDSKENTEGTDGEDAENTISEASEANVTSEPIFIYEVINNRCARMFYTHKQLLALANFAWVGGIRVDHETDTVELCKGVQVDQLSSIQGTGAFELGNKLMSQEQLEASTMAELFTGVTPQANSSPFDGLKDLGEIINSEAKPDGEGTEATEATEIEGTAPENMGEDTPEATPAEPESSVVTNGPTSEEPATETSDTVVEAAAGSLVGEEAAEQEISTFTSESNQPITSENPTAAEGEPQTEGEPQAEGEQHDPTPTEQAEAAFTELTQEENAEGSSTPSEEASESEDESNSSTNGTRSKSSKGKNRRKH